MRQGGRSFACCAGALLVVATGMATAAQPSPVPGYTAQDLQVVAGNLGMVIVPCEIGAPDFVARHADAFGGYRRRHASAIAYVESQREHAAMVAQMKSPQGIQQARAMAGAFCQEKAIPNLKRLGRAHDPRLATPEGSWNFLRAALAAADRAQALLVIDPGYEGLVERIRSASDGELKKISRAMGEIDVKRTAPDRVTAAEPGPDGKPRGVGVTFRAIFGEWYVTDGFEGAFAR